MIEHEFCNFNVTCDIDNPEYLFIRHEDFGEIIIKQNEEGIVVDIYDNNDSEEIITSTWAQRNEFSD